MKIDFSGQVALVTGATRGIGRRIAADLAEAGARVIATGTRHEGGGRSGRGLAMPRRGTILRIAVDFSNQESTRGFLERIEKIQRIDVCVNNAGINRIAGVDEASLDDWRALEAVNLSAPFLVTRSVSKRMKANRFGRIVNIASIFGVISKAKRSLYSMSKFGLRGLTTASALDLAPYNVLVNSVSPGFVMTDLTRRILTKTEMDRLAGQVPLGRFARPDEVSKAVLFLASCQNTYITAQNLIVDGGFVNV